MLKDTIVIHHSLTKDGLTVDWNAIRRYHKETNGWRDIGYHYGIEYVNGVLTVQKGRPEAEDAAATKEQSMNKKGIHICVVGNFDLTKPSEEVYIKLADLCQDIIARNKTVKAIEPHTKYATYKTCPGKLFNMNYLRQLVFAPKVDLRPEIIRMLSVTIGRVKDGKSIKAQIDYSKKVFDEYLKLGGA